jgi:hypothetical protein
MSDAGSPRLEAILERKAVLADLIPASREQERQVTSELWDYVERPVEFVTKVLGETLWSRQRDIMNSVRDNRYTAVPSSHGVGKSFCAARVVAWWLSTHPVGQAFAVTTAPTFTQVRAILWQQIHRAHADGDLPGRINQTEWWMGDEMVAFGRKPSDYNPAAFQGIHARHVLIVIDEASGVGKHLWDAADTLMTNKLARLLAIGNPDDSASQFAKVCRPASGYNVLPISAFDSPNFTREKVPARVKEELVGKEWVEERRARWGEGSALWQAKVLGEFPEISDDTLIPLSWVERGRERGRENWPKGGGKELGVDVARFGSDLSVIGLREGKSFRVLWVGAKANTMETTGHVVSQLETTGAMVAKVDVVGLGAGVVDRLAELGRPVVAMSAGMPAIDTERFANARAEWWWNLRELFEANQAIVDPDDEELADQLSVQKYKLDSRGRILLESKDDMKRRGVRSPDRADSMAMAFAPVIEPEEYIVTYEDRVRIR